MGDTNVRFGAVVVASLAGIVGTKYLVGATLALLSNWRRPATIPEVSAGPLVVGESFVVTVVCGILLLVVTGGLLTGLSATRPLGIATFLLVVGVSIPSILALEPFVTVESVGLLWATVYLLRHRPTVTESDATVDESTSASRFGSTLR